MGGKISKQNAHIYFFNNNGYLDFKSTNNDKNLENRLSVSNIRSLVTADVNQIFHYKYGLHTASYIRKSDIPEYKTYHVKINGKYIEILVDLSRLD